MSSKFEVLSENFDLFFANELDKITPDAKDLLPSDVVFKLFRKGGEVNAKGTSRLSFIAKIYVLFLLYPGKEIQSSSIYHETFKRAYQSSPNKIKAAFSTLQQRKFIEKYGTTKKVS